MVCRASKRLGYSSPGQQRTINSLHSCPWIRGCWGAPPKARPYGPTSTWEPLQVLDSTPARGLIAMHVGQVPKGGPGPVRKRPVPQLQDPQVQALHALPDGGQLGHMGAAGCVVLQVSCLHSRGASTGVNGEVRRQARR